MSMHEKRILNDPFKVYQMGQMPETGVPYQDTWLLTYRMRSGRIFFRLE